MKHPRQIDAALVDAYLARRALDYLVGFTLSPVLWRKLPGARSAGRVQSVALRLVCERENEIEVFKPREYWSVAVTLEPPNGGRFVARVVGCERRKAGPSRHSRRGNGEAHRGRAEIGRLPRRFDRGEAASAATRRRPSPPRRLQQEASRKLGFSASRTMQVAQRLYEDGLITYMRTDGVQIGAGSDQPPPARSSPSDLATATCRTSRASTRPRPRTRRKPTRPSARPILAIPPTRRAASKATRHGSTS